MRDLLLGALILLDFGKGHPHPSGKPDTFPYLGEGLLSLQVSEFADGSEKESLAAARSRSGSDSPLDCHSIPLRRFATRCGSVTFGGKQHSVVFLHPQAASLPRPLFSSPCSIPTARDDSLAVVIHSGVHISIVVAFGQPQGYSVYQFFIAAFVICISSKSAIS